MLLNGLKNEESEREKKMSSAIRYSIQKKKKEGKTKKKKPPKG